jgi:hypothetical protein
MIQRSETEQAFFERPEPDLLEVRLKPGIRIDKDCVSALMHERIHLCGGEPLCVLVTVPTDAELDIAVMSVDHHQLNESGEGVRAVAILTESLMLETMARLYVAYFPTLFQTEVFNLQADAREWLAERLTELRAAGQKA